MLVFITFSLCIAVVACLCYSLAKIYVRTGHMRIWPTAAFVPLVLALMGLGSAFVAGFSSVSILLLVAAAAVWFGLIVHLAIKHWPTDATLSPEVFE